MALPKNTSKQISAGKAKNQLISIQFVDRKIQELQLEQATYQTARNAYAKALSDILQKDQGRS